MSQRQALLLALQAHAGKRRRLEIAEIWQVFRDALPIDFADRGRGALAEQLHQLAGEGALRLPKQPSLWDHSAAPPLPAWAELSAHGPLVEIVDHRTIPWPPELARLVDEPRVAPDLLRDLLAIKRFLAEGGREREPVPLRERSAELLRDEKRLDALLGAALFRRLGVTADLLRAFTVPVPIVWERGPIAAHADHLLVLENLHTYDSFRRWNARVGAHLGVVYGGGKAFAGMLQDLARIAIDLGAAEIHYFGDLDVEGLRIPASAAFTLRARDLALLPATRWYQHLLTYAPEHHLPAPEPLTDPRLLTWLPDHLRAPTHGLLAAQRRLPQELIGWDLLRGEPPLALPAS
jgi:hypothetical protein